MMNIIADDGKGPKWVTNELYGREEELKLLNSLAEGKISSVVLLEGAEGTGKAALIHHVEWELNDWVFVSNKFDKSLSAEPYSALKGALDHLVTIWVENNKTAEVCQMKSFLQVLNDDVDLLVNVIPGVFRIVEKFAHGACFSKGRSIRDLTGSGDHYAEEKVGADSGAIASAFLRLFSFLSSAKPIVLFLADVQYADASSMDILEIIAETAATKPIKYSSHLLLAIAYRKELLEKNKFASKTVASVKNFGDNVHSLHLQDFDMDAMNQMVASLVNADPPDTLPVSSIIHKKTAGNPFAVSQFLRIAREKGYFTFSSMTYKWEWGDPEVLDCYASITDNVAEVLSASMDKLCISTKVTLKVSSCLGKIIPTHVLVEYFKEFFDFGKGHTTCQAIVGIKEHGLEPLLDGACKAGILVKSMSQGAYMWSNDRLQQAAYDMIPEEMRNELHRKLGMLLWRLGLKEDEEWMIFMAATQMNKYAELQCECKASLGNEVAKLSLQAAKLSLKKGAIYPALDLLVNAEKHMDSANRWTDSYDLTLEVLTTLAESHFKVGEVEAAVETARMVVDNGKTLNDKFRAHIILLEGRMAQNDRSYDIGVEKTLELLQLYGEKHPKKFFPGQKCVEKAKLKKMLPGGELDGLLELPNMTDQSALQIHKLLVEYLSPYSKFSTKYKSLSWFACVRALKKVCKFGISPDSPMAVLGLATQMSQEGHYKEASEYADFALLLLERIPRQSGSNHGYVRMVASVSVFSAVRSLNKCLNELLESRADTLRAGLVRESISIVVSYGTVYLCLGLPIGAFESDLVAYLEEAKSFGVVYTVQQVMMIQRQTILNLQHYTNNPTLLSGLAMDQETELKKVEGHARKMTLRDINTHRLLLSVVFGDWPTAEAMMEALEEYVDADDAFLVRTHFRRSYIGLACFALSRKAKTTKARKKFLAIGKKMLKHFTTDMKYGSVNAYPIASMLEAEESPSKEKYDKAVRACARLGLVHYEAYMCERAAEFFDDQNDDGWSEFYAGQAILLYGEWGATGKADRLTEDYSHVLTKSSLRESVNSSLQGRSRYSSKELDSLRTIDWESFSVGSDLGNDDSSLLEVEP